MLIRSKNHEGIGKPLPGARQDLLTVGDNMLISARHACGLGVYLYSYVYIYIFVFIRGWWRAHEIPWVYRSEWVEPVLATLKAGKKL